MGVRKTGGAEPTLFSKWGGGSSPPCPPYFSATVSGLHSHMQVFLSKICLEVHVSATDRSRQSQRQVDSLNICPCAQLSDSRHSQRLITGLNCSKGPQVGVMIRSRHSQSRSLNSSSISQESLASSGHSHIHVSMLNLFRHSYSSWLAHPHAHSNTAYIAISKNSMYVYREKILANNYPYEIDCFVLATGKVNVSKKCCY